jgi:PAS domain S-box-containing protein
MKTVDDPPDAAELRARAETACHAAVSPEMERKEAGLPEATSLLLHELRVHNVELEMQNEELLRAQEELAVSRARYFDLYDLAPVGYVTHSEAGVILQANVTAATLLGVARADLVEQPLSKIIQKEDLDSYYLLWKKILATGEAQSGELRLVKSDGGTFWARLEGATALDEGAPVVRVVLSDITVPKQAELEREQLERKMQNTQKLESLGVLAGGIAHDFNNILTCILGSASLASQELPPGSPLHARLESIKEQSLRAAEVCKQILAYSGRGRFVIQRLDLGQLVEETVQMLKVSISKKAALRFHLEKGLPPVNADATQLRQVIMNLVINASEAIGDESGVITLATGLARVDSAYLAGSLLPPDLPKGEYAFLEVSDNGSGMSAETQAKIFDPFFTTKFTGRGLGLATVLGIVRVHKGAMKVESEAGRGTTFRLLFPAVSGFVETPQAHRLPPAGRWRGQGVVLVVDDEETIRNLTAQMLTLAGFDPVIVADGREAVEIFRAAPDRFALVLLDLTMPNMGGEETFAELQKLRPDVPVVLMSGYFKQDVLVRFANQGPAGFLQKPFTVDDLRLELQPVLG